MRPPLAVIPPLPPFFWPCLLFFLSGCGARLDPAFFNQAAEHHDRLYQEVQTRATHLFALAEKGHAQKAAQEAQASKQLLKSWEGAWRAQRPSRGERALHAAVAAEYVEATKLLDLYLEYAKTPPHHVTGRQAILQRIEQQEGAFHAALEAFLAEQEAVAKRLRLKLEHPLEEESAD